MAQTFGRRLGEVRGRLKITQQDLAARTGLRQASLSNLEGNKKKPSITTIERLATALNVAPLDLVAGTEMHGRYASERVSPGDREIQEKAERRRQSSKIVAIHEIYRRIVALHQLHLTGHVLEGPDARGEAYFQHLREQLLDACAEAGEINEKLNLIEALYVTSTLDPEQYVIDGFLFDDESQRYEEQAIRRSEALILKWILRYPDADDATARQEIAERLHLESIDRYIEALQAERETSAELTRQTLDKAFDDRHIDKD